MTPTAAFTAALTTGVSSGLIVLVSAPLVFASLFGGLPMVSLALAGVVAALGFAAALVDRVVTGRPGWLGHGFGAGGVGAVAAGVVVANSIVGGSFSSLNLAIVAAAAAAGSAGVALLVGGIRSAVVSGLVVLALTATGLALLVATDRSQAASDEQRALFGVDQVPWVVKVDGYHWLNTQVRARADGVSLGVIEMIFRRDAVEDVHPVEAEDLVVRARALDDTWWSPGTGLPAFDAFCVEPYREQVVVSCVDQGGVWVQVGDAAHTVARIDGGTLVAVTADLSVDFDVVTATLDGARPLTDAEHAQLISWSMNGDADRPEF